MLLRTDNKEHTDYEENWPLHYYEITDIDERERILKKIISDLRKETDSGSQSLNEVLSQNERRLEILLKRYPEKKVNGVRVDNFIAAWMNLLITGRLGINFLNKGRIRKEVTQYLKDLCVLDFPTDEILIKEWEDFAKFWIKSCVEDKTYDSTIFGLIRLNDKNLASKIAGDILDISYFIPSKFGYENDCKAFRSVLKKTYTGMIDNGVKYWNEMEPS
ncbi:DUF6553 family protein [Oribacterium sp. P6A1]|uniref:DUF6553 family protein n=1 Tax=Oribacterium sp. P6A1 TaxID=1410612 RepID=UPI00055D9536|nr:DUF6553 family protein [Oribacterium sp. P6A1]